MEIIFHYFEVVEKKNLATAALCYESPFENSKDSQDWIQKVVLKWVDSGKTYVNKTKAHHPEHSISAIIELPALKSV